jgi:hypothetical protein
MIDKGLTYAYAEGGPVASEGPNQLGRPEDYKDYQTFLKTLVKNPPEDLKNLKIRNPFKNISLRIKRAQALWDQATENGLVSARPAGKDSFGLELVSSARDLSPPVQVTPPRNLLEQLPVQYHSLVQPVLAPFSVQPVAPPPEQVAPPPEQVAPPPVQPVAPPPVQPVFPPPAQVAPPSVPPVAPPPMLENPVSGGIFGEVPGADYVAPPPRTYSPDVSSASPFVRPTYTPLNYGLDPSLSPPVDVSPSVPVNYVPPSYTPYPIYPPPPLPQQSAEDTRAAGYNATMERFANSPFVRPEGIGSLQLGKMKL